MIGLIFTTTEHWDVLNIVRARFPLCDVDVHDVLDQGGMRVTVRDAGGLAASDIWFPEDDVHVVLDRIADVFDVPSHWMAL